MGAHRICRSWRLLVLYSFSLSRLQISAQRYGGSANDNQGGAPNLFNSASLFNAAETSLPEQPTKQADKLRIQGVEAPITAETWDPQPEPAHVTWSSDSTEASDAAASLDKDSSGSAPGGSSGFLPLVRPPFEQFDFDYTRPDDEYGTQVDTRRLQKGVWRLTSDPSRFDCENKQCGMHDEFFELKDARADSTPDDLQCKGAIPKHIGAYKDVALQLCPYNVEIQRVWTDCRTLYCEAFERVKMAVTNGTEYYLGAECHDLLYFNKTICLTYYRDANAFCDCLCPALPVLFEESIPACR